MRYVNTLSVLALAALAGCSEATEPAVGAAATSGRTASGESATAASSRPDEPAAAAEKGHWPNWRGPKHDGISRETGWTAKWRDGGPKIAWKTDVGTGYSSMSVAGGRLYTMGHRDGKEFVYCLDAATGDEVWTRSYPAALVDNLHRGGPGATPTIDGERIYTTGREGMLYCLSARDGAVVWSVDLQKELDVELPAWGFTSSPLVLKDMLVVEAGRVAAFDKKTGKRLWQTEDAYDAGYGSPAPLEAGGEQLLAVLNNECLLVVRAKDGSKIATYPWSTSFDTSSTTPVVSGETIFISTGYNEGCALLRLTDGTLEEVYKNREMRNHFNNSVLYEGKLYGIDGNSHASRTCKLVCMDHQTGKVEWIKRGFGCGSLLVADGRLIVLGDKGLLATAEATPEEYREISRAQVLDGESECWTVPVLAGGRIYCRDSAGNLVCVDVRE